MSYEQEIQMVRAQYGDLETIRKSLGFSRRKICEYLLVDPSAWTRWVNSGTDQAPPHVYRTLGLLLEKVKAQPDYLYKVGAVDPVSKIKWQEELTGLSLELKQNVQENLTSHIESLKKQVSHKEELTLGWKLLLLINIVLVLYVLFR